MKTPLVRAAVILAILISAAGCNCCANRPTPQTQPTAAAATVQSTATIVRLVGRDTTVTIAASGAGPRYSATSKTGQMLATNLTLSELREQHPQIYRFVDPDAVADTRDTTDTARQASGTTTSPTAWAGLDAGAD